MLKKEDKEIKDQFIDEIIKLLENEMENINKKQSGKKKEMKISMNLKEI